MSAHGATRDKADFTDRERALIKSALNLSALDVETGGGAKWLSDEYRALARRFETPALADG